MTHDVTRCFGTGNPLYEEYHDHEWGVAPPSADREHRLYEQLALEGFMVGLSWFTVLQKRDALRKAFREFVPHQVARLGPQHVARMLKNPAVIRNPRKIHAAITNAKVLCQLHQEGESLHEWFEEHRPEPVPARSPNTASWRRSTPETVALTRKMKDAGFTFVGPTTLYATMQALGYVDDHVATCFKVSEPAGVRH